MNQLILQKILYGNTVYIQLDIAAKALDTTTEKLQLHCYDTKSFDGVGLCVAETEFNNIRAKYYPTADVNMQFTHVESLEVEASHLYSFQPIRNLLFPGLDASFQGVNMQVKLQETQRRLVAKQSMQQSIKQFQDQIEYLKAKIPLQQYGLQLQILTIVSPEHIQFKMFLSGVGVFYEIQPDCLDYEYWDESTQDKSGNIIIPTPDDKNQERVIKRVSRKDFRQSSVIENIQYCVRKIEAKNEWTDYLEIRQDGVEFSVSMNMIMRMLNPQNCKEEYYFEGIPKFVF